MSLLLCYYYVIVRVRVSPALTPETHQLLHSGNGVGFAVIAPPREVVGNGTHDGKTLVAYDEAHAFFEALGYLVKLCELRKDSHHRVLLVFVGNIAGEVVGKLVGEAANLLNAAIYRMPAAIVLGGNTWRLGGCIQVFPAALPRLFAPFRAGRPARASVNDLKPIRAAPLFPGLPFAPQVTVMMSNPLFWCFCNSCFFTALYVFLKNSI